MNRQWTQWLSMDTLAMVLLVTVLCQCAEARRHPRHNNAAQGTTIVFALASFFSTNSSCFCLKFGPLFLLLNLNI